MSLLRLRWSCFARALVAGCALLFGLTAAAPVAPSDPEVRRLERHLPDFVERRSGRFILFSDLEAKAARRMLETMEATSLAAERFAEEFALPRRAIDRSFVGVAFASREGFERFARRIDGVDATWMSGYWLPGSERIVVRRGGVEERGARRGSAALASASSSELATVAHETAHQVLHRLGVQRRSPGHPLWISEGLAVAFERVALHGAEADPFGPQPERAARVAAAQRAGRLHPLAALVSTPTLPKGDRASARAFYDQSWSLTRHLATTRPEQFAEYLRTLAREAGRLNPRRSVEIFERSFGPLAGVERAWHSAN